MSPGRSTGHRTATALGFTGDALGVLAGTVQALTGAQIPTWTVAKQSPVGPGPLTIVFSLLAAFAAHRPSRRPTSLRSGAVPEGQSDPRRRAGS